MSLLWIKCGSEVLCGESFQPSYDTAHELPGVLTIKNPMLVQFVQMQQQGKLHGSKPQTVLGYKLVNIPCGEIRLNEVSYVGEVPETDNVYVLYYKVLESMKEAEAPLQIAQ